MTETVRGYLTITVIEASGKNKDDNYVWDSLSFQGFVKVELRGGPRNIKVTTRTQPVTGTAILWNEELSLEVLDNANELRVMLCKERISTSSNRRGGAVIAACGIFVNDILDAVPIDKYFELFKPQAGGEGGFIRLGLDFTKEPKVPLSPETAPSGALSTADSIPNGTRASSVAATGTLGLAGPAGMAQADSAPRPAIKQQKKKRRGLWIALPLVLAALVAAGGVVGKKLYDERQEKEGHSTPQQQEGSKPWPVFGGRKV